MNYFPRNIAIFFTSLMIYSATQTANAVDSTTLAPPSHTPMAQQSYVNTTQGQCRTLTSSPYVIALGNGGGNMKLTCPKDIPVMTNWHFKVGYGGFGSVQTGGGVTKITCCPVANKWSAKTYA